VVEASNIPKELRERPQWVCYRVEEREGKNTKVPYSLDGSKASSTDPASWTSFETACAACERFDGIGFVFCKDDPFTGVDLDHCIVDGKIEPWAVEIAKRLNTYTEYSPSGTGLHCILQAVQSHHSKRKGKVEAYDQGRYFTITGRRIKQLPTTVEPRQSELDAVLLEMFGPNGETEKTTHCPQAPLDMSDLDLIGKATSARNGPKFAALFSGDISGYTSASEADLALCNMLAFWTGRDSVRMDRMFRQSGLYRADKWDRQDYREGAINKAIVDCHETYNPNRTIDGRSTYEPADSETKPPTDYKLTDLGNAERLVAAHGTNIRHDVNRKQWLVWNGKRWEYDENSQVNRLAANVVRSLYENLAEVDEARRKAIFAHASKSESAPRLSAMVSLAAEREHIPVFATSLDSDSWLLNCLNGTIDLRTGKLKPHTREDHITKLIPVEYDSSALCPRYLQFLSEIFPGESSTELIAFVKRMAGYILTGNTREQTVFILTGKGANGKSTLVEVLRAILGDYAGDTPMSTFTDKRESNTADLAGLLGRRLVTAAEGEETQDFNESLLKTLSGGDPITCRKLYCDFFSYTPTFKVIISTNEIPHIRSQNFAMKRRIKLLPFQQRFYDPEDEKTPIKDDQLLSKLLAEKSGILAWMVQGCLEWQSSGIKTPPIIKREVSQLFESQDPLRDFLEESCVIEDDARVEVGEIRQEYLRWCEYNKIRKPMSVVWFSRSLLQRDGIEEARGKGGVRGMTGIRVKTTEERFTESEEKPKEQADLDWDGLP
jgi:putative DNA primase/helicase